MWARGTLTNRQDSYTSSCVETVILMNVCSVILVCLGMINLLLLHTNHSKPREINPFWYLQILIILQKFLTGFRFMLEPLWSKWIYSTDFCWGMSGRLKGVSGLLKPHSTVFFSLNDTGLLFKKGISQLIKFKSHWLEIEVLQTFIASSLSVNVQTWAVT